MDKACKENETSELALDFTYLTRQTLGDAALEAELLRAFQIQAEGILRRLRGQAPPTAHERADFAHLLKGSARAIGAIRVGRAAEAFETDCSGEGPAADAALRDLAEAIMEASNVIALTLAKTPFAGSAER